VGPKANVNAVEKRKCPFIAPAGNPDGPAHLLVTILTELSRLSKGKENNIR